MPPDPPSFSVLTHTVAPLFDSKMARPLTKCFLRPCMLDGVKIDILRLICMHLAYTHLECRATYSHLPDGFLDHTFDHFLVALKVKLYRLFFQRIATPLQPLERSKEGLRCYHGEQIPPNYNFKPPGSKSPVMSYPEGQHFPIIKNLLQVQNHQ